MKQRRGNGGAFILGLVAGWVICNHMHRKAATPPAPTKPGPVDPNYTPLDGNVLPANSVPSAVSGGPCMWETSLNRFLYMTA